MAPITMSMTLKSAFFPSWYNFSAPRKARRSTIPFIDYEWPDSGPKGRDYLRQKPSLSLWHPSSVMQASPEGGMAGTFYEPVGMWTLPAGRNACPPYPHPLWYTRGKITEATVSICAAFEGHCFSNCSSKELILVQMTRCRDRSFTVSQL